MPKVSIILPTYNVAPYLLQCLESIEKQSFNDYEVIVVVDGATDGSFEIAQNFCKNHDKFKVVWQENAGSGVARNNGLNHADGEFVMFIDPDDWIEPDLLMNLVEGQKCGNCDLVATRRNKAVCSNDGKIIKTIYSSYKEEFLDDIQKIRMAYYRMLRLDVLGSPTQKLYKMSIIRDHSVFFPDLRRSQDVVFNYRYYNYVRSLRLLPYSGYNYRVLHENSSGRTKADYYKTILYVYNDYQNMYASWNLSFPDNDFCNFFYDIRIFANLQRCADQGWDMASIVEEPTIHHMIENSGKVSVVKRIARVLILKKKYFLLRIYMKLIVSMKQHGLG